METRVIVGTSAFLISSGSLMSVPHKDRMLLVNVLLKYYIMSSNFGYTCNQGVLHHDLAFFIILAARPQVQLCHCLQDSSQEIEGVCLLFHYYGLNHTTFSIHQFSVWESQSTSSQFTGSQSTGSQFTGSQFTQNLYARTVVLRTEDQSCFSFSVRA